VEVEMQVLGDLIKLPDNNYIPLPWWHRAPLGFQSKTWCYVALVESKKRPVPDVIVSVLDPSNRDKMLRIKCTHPDEPGVISKAITIVKKFNIALAETVTAKMGELHDITFVCEPVDGNSRAASKSQLEQRLREAGFTIVRIHSYEAMPYSKIWRGEVQAGWITNVNWRSKMAEMYGQTLTSTNIDLSKAVVSADTTDRLLRFVFPYKDAKTIQIEHLDKPGALEKITNVLFENDLNLLSMLLRRGGARPDMAVLVAACEPKDGVASKQMYKNVESGIHKLPAKLMTEIRITDGIDANQTITPKEPDTIVARIPSNLVEKVRKAKSSIPHRKLPVFFSHRFVQDAHVQQLVGEVRQSLFDNRCYLLEASLEDDVAAPNLVFIEVSAKMWLAKAGVVLVTKLDRDDALGKNLPHEFGFLQGQGKPILVLAESGAPPLWSNVDGIYVPRFPPNKIAFQKSSKGSIHDIITQWVRRVANPNYAEPDMQKLIIRDSDVIIGTS
jgi:predicted amino acid-binding ACT domain protein